MTVWSERGSIRVGRQVLWVMARQKRTPAPTRIAHMWRPNPSIDSCHSCDVKRSVVFLFRPGLSDVPTNKPKHAKSKYQNELLSMAASAHAGRFERPIVPAVHDDSKATVERRCCAGRFGLVAFFFGRRYSLYVTKNRLRPGPSSRFGRVGSSLPAPKHHVQSIRRMRDRADCLLWASNTLQPGGTCRPIPLRTHRFVVIAVSSVRPHFHHHHHHPMTWRRRLAFLHLPAADNAIFDRTNWRTGGATRSTACLFAAKHSNQSTCHTIGPQTNEGPGRRRALAEHRVLQNRPRAAKMSASASACDDADTVAVALVVVVLELFLRCQWKEQSASLSSSSLLVAAPAQ
jgi:hypothetical protein